MGAEVDAPLDNGRTREDLRRELAQYGVPIVTNVEFLQRINEELGRPGTDAGLAAGSGHLLGATHVLTGRFTPSRNTRNELVAEIEIKLVDVESQKESSMGTAVVSRKIGRDWFR